MAGISFVLFLIAFVPAAALLPLGRKLALKLDFVDKPGGRKKHDDDVPLVGGLVIFPLFIVLAFCFVPDLSGYGAFFAALMLLVATGALDDKNHVPAWIKFGVQFVAAFLIVLGGGAKIIVMGDLFGFGSFGLNFMAVPFSVIATVLLINAVNLMDGLDGLSGGMGFIILSWLALACVLAGAFAPLAAIMLMLGVLGAFLLFNLRTPIRKSASIFLGDAGSLALGLALAWFTIGLARTDVSVIHPISVAWLLALPIYDTCGQFARRVREGRHPFDADSDHFHHHFIHAGFSVGQATATILGIVFLCGLIGIGGIQAGVHPAFLTYPWIGFLLIHIYLSMKPGRYRSIIGKLRRDKTAQTIHESGRESGHE